MSNWHDAKNDVWLNRERLVSLDEADKTLFNDLKVIYQTGKGNHLVPFLVPKDTVAALDKLCDLEVRLSAGILVENTYLFPSTKGSSEHVYGWYAVHRICGSADVEKPDLLTATKMRHRVSTLYAGLEVPEIQRSHFYYYTSIYQSPLAEVEISQVGRVLQTFDENNVRQVTSTATCSTSLLVCSSSATSASFDETVSNTTPSGEAETSSSSFDKTVNNTMPSGEAETTSFDETVSNTMPSDEAETINSASPENRYM
jgi:hypothetical protein